MTEVSEPPCSFRCKPNLALTGAGVPGLLHGAPCRSGGRASNLPAQQIAPGIPRDL